MVKDSTGAARTYEVDAHDLEILKELKRNARQSARELSKRLGMHPATVLQRMGRMETAGIIRGYRADLDLTSLGYEFMGVIEVTIAKGALLDVQREISRMHSVVWVYDVTGEFDSLVLVACKNRQQFSSLVKRILSLTHVTHTNTHVVLNIVKHTEEFLPE